MLTNELKKLTDINKDLKFNYRNKEQSIDVIDFKSFVDSTFYGSPRFTPGSAFENIKLSINYNGENIISMAFSEFYPCCGKIVGKHLYVRDKIIIYKGEIKSFTEDEMNEITKIFMKLIEEVLVYTKYTSVTFIVSFPEQPLFYKLITKLNTYKVINEFNNNRMSNKNKCIEFCRNFC